MPSRCDRRWRWTLGPAAPNGTRTRCRGQPRPLRQALLELQRHGRVERRSGARAGRSSRAKVNASSRGSGLAATRRAAHPQLGAGIMARERAAARLSRRLEIARVSWCTRSGGAVGQLRPWRSNAPTIRSRDCRAAERPLDGSLDALLRADYGIAAETAVEHLERSRPGRRRSRRSASATGAPLMYVERISYEADGRRLSTGRTCTRRPQPG